MKNSSSDKSCPVLTPELLICPECSERLTPADVESFARCPYCDYAFKVDARLDDFVISPMVSRWVTHIHQHFPRS